MGEARMEESWSHTGQICAVVANRGRGKGEKSYKPKDFMPRFGPKPKPLPGTIEDLKIFLPENQGGKPKRH
jgi:hypothetical protein